MSPASPYRWAVVAAATVGMAAAFGATSTVSILIAPFETEHGWARAEISFAYTLLTVGAAAGGLIAGRLADRLPTAPIAMTGAAILALGLMLVGQQSSLRAIQLVYFGLGALGFACLYAPLLSSVARWFDRGHGLALGLVTSGGALGQAIVPQLFQALVAAQGWRDACVLLGCGYLAVVVPGMALIRKPAAGGGAGFAPAPAAWPVPPAVGLALLGAAALFCCALMAVPTVHLVAFVADRGHDPAAAAGVVTVLMLAGVVGRVATGALVDRLGSLTAYALVSAMQTAGICFFVAADTLAGLWLVAAAYGLGFGGVMTAMVCAVRDAVPQRTVGSAMALVGLLAWLGMGAGGLQAGICFDLTGSYALSFQTAALAGILNLAALGALAALIRLRAAPLAA